MNGSEFGKVDIEYDETNKCYSLDRTSSRTMSTTAILAIAEIADIDPLAMEPAYDGYNLETLDQVASWQDAAEVEVEGSVTVTIADHRVRLESNGTLSIFPPA